MLQNNNLLKTLNVLAFMGASALTGLVLSPSSAHALSPLTEYNTNASFTAATQNVSTVNFSGLAAAGSFQQETTGTAGLLAGQTGTGGTGNGSVTFGEANTANQLFVVSTSAASPFYAFNSSATGTDAGFTLDELGTGNGAGIVATFANNGANGVYAVGADIETAGTNSAGSFTVTVDTVGEAGGVGSIFTVPTSAQPTSTFIGFVSNTQGAEITDIKFVPTGGITQVGNFQFAQAKVPFELNSSLGVSLLGCLWGGNLLLKKRIKKVA